MKFTCTQENLIKNLNIVSHLSSKNISLPILNNILIDVSDDGIKFLSTNLEIGIKINVRGKVEKKGRITLPAKILSSFVNLLPEDKVEFELLENNEMKISSGSWQTKIKTQPADDYPLIPEVNKKSSFKVDLGQFKKALNATIFAAVNNEARPELSGGLFRLKDKNLKLVTTDSYRLAEKTIELNENNYKGKDFIVPIRSLQELSRVLGDYANNQEMSVYIEENQILFVVDSLEFSSRLIDGEYPDYKQILPQTSTTQVKFSKAEIMNAIKAAGLFSKIGIFDINFEFKTPNKIIIKSSNNQLGENTAEIKGKVSGENNQIVFNYHYVLEGLSAISQDNVIMELTGPENPAVIKPENKEDYLYLIMSIRQ